MTMLINIQGTFVYNKSDSDSFHGQGYYIIKFSIFQRAELIKFMVHLKICLWILRKVFDRTEALFFILITGYGCFSFMYVWRSVELQRYR